MNHLRKKINNFVYTSELLAVHVKNAFWSLDFLYGHFNIYFLSLEKLLFFFIYSPRMELNTITRMVFIKSITLSFSILPKLSKRKEKQNKPLLKQE